MDNENNRLDVCTNKCGMRSIKKSFHDCELSCSYRDHHPGPCGCEKHELKYRRDKVRLSKKRLPVVQGTPLEDVEITVEEPKKSLFDAFKTYENTVFAFATPPLSSKVYHLANDLDALARRLFSERRFGDELAVRRAINILFQSDTTLNKEVADRDFELAHLNSQLDEMAAKFIAAEARNNTLIDRNRFVESKSEYYMGCRDEAIDYARNMYKEVSDLFTSLESKFKEAKEKNEERSKKFDLSVKDLEVAK